MPNVRAIGEGLSDTEKDALARALGLRTGPEFQDVEIKRQGKTIVMPEGMTHEKAIEWHKRKMEEETRMYAISEVVDAYPLDGARAFMMVLKKIYGWTDVLPGWFDPPQMISVEVGFGETEQVVWGKVQIPGIEGYLKTGMTTIDKRVVFCINGNVQHKDKGRVKEIADLTRELVKTESIYRNKAITINFPDPDDDDFNPMTHAPKFLDLSKVKRDELIFPQQIERMLEATTFAPLMFPQRCRDLNIPLKRGILLEGPFGTGKTLTQYVAAKIAVEAGWTAIYLQDIERLDEAMQFAKQYQPALIIGEDIDRADTNGSRSDTMNDILNTIDGVEMKHAEIMVILTTNEVAKIHKAMLRPGRLDAVIPVRAPDAEAAERLIRLYARGRLMDNEDLLAVGVKLKGRIPAVIREVVERAKLAAVFRLGSANREVHSMMLASSDLEVAADGMNEHLKLLEISTPDTREPIEKGLGVLADALLVAYGKKPLATDPERSVLDSTREALRDLQPA